MLLYEGWLLVWQRSLDSCPLPAPVWWCTASRRLLSLGFFLIPDYSAAWNEDGNYLLGAKRVALTFAWGHSSTDCGRLSRVIISYAKICSIVLHRLPFDQRMGIELCLLHGSVVAKYRLIMSGRVTSQKFKSDSKSGWSLRWSYFMTRSKQRESRASRARRAPEQTSSVDIHWVS
jgi:hypothetical protein